jgi:hypothetical protein
VQGEKVLGSEGTGGISVISSVAGNDSLVYSVLLKMMRHHRLGSA